MELPKKLQYKISVVIDAQEYPVGYPVCGGCPHLTLSSQGWFCFWMQDTSDCAYPTKREAATPLEQQEYET